ncbi:MAG: acyltransferase family protein [Candidatus Hodarchaeota archaeon]
MKRIKTIDNIRGLCIFLMVLGHILGWWMRPEDLWLSLILNYILGDIAGGGFLFVSGLSAVIFFRSRLNKHKTSDDISIKQVNNEYLIRALLILVVALLYNSATAIGTLNPLNIWKWFIPLTIATSLLFGYPLLKTSKSFRLFFAAFIWIAHFLILSYLLPYQGQYNIFGIIYYVLYNPIGLHPILNYFSFFIIGTVVGDVMFEVYIKNDRNERQQGLKNKLWLPSLIIGPVLILIGVLFFFPNFLKHGTFSSIFYSLGVLLILFSLLLILEEFETFKVKKNYTFFYFYSYYSLTIYFSHNILYFLFLSQLNVITVWIATVGTFILLTLLIRVIYKKYREKASLKAQIARLTIILVRRIEIKKRR